MMNKYRNNCSMKEISNLRMNMKMMFGIMPTNFINYQRE